MPASANDYFKQAMAALQAGQLNEAERHFKQVLRTNPAHVAALNLLSVALTHLQRYAEAETYIKSAIALNANSDATFYNYALILKSLERPAEAAERFSQALAINPSSTETWNNRGTVLDSLGRHTDAIDDYDKAIGLQSNYPEAFCNKAKSLTELARYDEAFAAYDRALSLKPDLVEAWMGRGRLCFLRGRYEDAIAAYDKALALKPTLAGVWLGRGNASFQLKFFEQALAAFGKALTLEPAFSEAWLARGDAFYHLTYHEDAIAAYDEVLKRKPEVAAAWRGRGNALSQLKRFEEAVVAYDKALALDRNLLGAEGSRLHAQMNICDWRDYDTACAHLIASVRNGDVSTSPFEVLTIPSSPADQLRSATNWISAKYSPFATPAWHGERYSHERIRIAYLSADFREHAVSYVIAGMIEAHDRRRFEIFGLSFGPADGSEIRSRIANSFDHFIEVGSRSDKEIAELIRHSEIDIAVDLMAFTGAPRTGIFAMRPAPIQVNYLGYSGTMGAPYIDYIIADRIVIPDDDRQFYAEKVVQLPDSFFVSDDSRPISTRALTREEEGLPENGFVFCCFNNNYKFTPQFFDVWMRLLSQVEGSVLWLREDNETVAGYLRKEAAKRGVGGERLIFARRAARIDEHLARLCLADLFLDTLPYSAHTTASDALWAGLPVLTCLGETFVGRAAASLLAAIGLPELIAADLDDYEAIALDLAWHPEKLADIERNLAENRRTMPLFNTKQYTRHIEAAYTTMVDWQRSGLPPDHIVVAD